MRTVDSYNAFNSQLHVSAFITAAGTKFLLLHEKANEDMIKQFFNEIYEYYVKMQMNPFYDGGKINDRAFTQIMLDIQKKYFT